MVLTVKPAALDKLIWTLVYGGLIGLALGLAVQRTDPALGWSLVAGGGLVGIAGAALVFVRARIEDTPGDES